VDEWIPLPEVPPPPGAEACLRCELARQRSRGIWGEGDPAAPVLVLLDNPGAREDAAGSPFVCGTRQTLQSAARAAGLPLDQIYVTWVLKCRPRRSYDKEAARAACLPYLGQQLGEHPRRIVIVLGNVALRGYHPLAVRRRPNLFPLLVADLQIAAQRAGFPVGPD
jgi:DNA polymerase